MVVGQGSLAGLRLGDRYAGLVRETAQRVRRARIDDTTAGHDEWPLRRSDGGHGARECGGIGRAPLHVPHALEEKLVRIVVGLRLHVLRQREGDRAGVGWTCEHAHRGDRRGHELLRAHDPVPVARYRLEGVVHARVAARRLLELLQDGI